MGVEIGGKCPRFLSWCLNVCLDPSGEQYINWKICNVKDAHRVQMLMMGSLRVVEW